MYGDQYESKLLHLSVSEIEIKIHSEASKKYEVMVKYG